MLGRRTLLVSLTLLLVIIGGRASAEEMRDVVYLKNGSIVKGIIVEQVPNKTLKLQTSDGSLFVFEFKDIEKIVKEGFDEATGSRKTPIPRQPGPRKQPVLAAGMSFLVPGAGQFYNEQWIKGIANIVIAGVGLGLIIENFSKVEQYYEEPWTYYGYRGNIPPFFAGVGIYGLNLIWAVVDAPLSAAHINKARGYAGLDSSYGNRLVLHSSSNTMALGPLPPHNCPRNLGLQREPSSC